MSAGVDPLRRLSLAGRMALVTGGGGAIGGAVCVCLRAAGARVVSLDLPGRPTPEGCDSRACDLTDSAEVQAAVDDAARALGRIDALVHCAGITRDARLGRLRDDDWRAVMAVNLDSAFFLLRAALPVLRAGGGGAVVMVSSINGQRGKVGQANYAASKAGLEALARTAAREGGPSGIRVNAVAPGWIDTPLTAGLSDDLRQRALDESALQRLGTPDDVAGAVLFLCCDLARHVTGQVLRVDGGQLMA